MVGQADAHRRALERSPRALDKASDDLGARSKGPPSGITYHKAAGALQGVFDWPKYEWPQQLEINDFAVASYTGERFGGPERFKDHVRGCHDSDIPSLPGNTRAVQWHALRPSRHYARDVVQPSMLKEDHRIVIVYGCK
jgi:hypothetical protein